MENIAAIKLHESKKFTNFLEILDGVEDKRNPLMIEYHLTDLLVIMIFTTLCGANNPTEIAEYCSDRAEWFSDILCLKLITPSHDTFLRILEMIKPDEFEFWIKAWSENMVDKSIKRHIAVDGKCDNANKKLILRAFDCESRAVLRHVLVPSGTNEITMMTHLLDKIDLRNAIITNDAMHTQRKNAAQIRRGGGNYIFIVKGNQHDLHEDIKLFLDDLLDNRPSNVPYSLAESSERAHGRDETRICLSTNAIAWLPNRHLWAGLRSASVIQTTRTTKKGLVVERRYCIASIDGDAVVILKLVRAHWGIENRCHWQLDNDFRSDWSTIRTDFAILNLSIIKDFCLYLLRKVDLAGSIRLRRARCAFHFYLMTETLIS